MGNQKRKIIVQTAHRVRERFKSLLLLRFYICVCCVSRGYVKLARGVKKRERERLKETKVPVCIIFLHEDAQSERSHLQHKTIYIYCYYYYFAPAFIFFRAKKRALASFTFSSCLTFCCVLSSCAFVAFAAVSPFSGPPPDEKSLSFS